MTISNTSGSVGNTIIDVVSIIDHAVRRAGIPPSVLTPEQLAAARDNLYLILTSIMNKGVNLWCVDRQYVPLVAEQIEHPLPVGTVDVLNANYAVPTVQTPNASLVTSSIIDHFESEPTVRLIGIQFRAAGTHDLTLDSTWRDYTDPDITWDPILSTGPFYVRAGEWKWFDLDAYHYDNNFRFRSNNGANLGTVIASKRFYISDMHEVPMSRLSRDSYTDLPNKTLLGRPLQYMFDKQLTPVVRVWPLSDGSEEALMVIWRQRQVQDVGMLYNKLEVPERWLEAVIWGLARNLAFELPGAAPDRIPLCTGMAEKFFQEAGDGETDGAPIFIQPNISGYTR